MTLPIVGATIAGSGGGGFLGGMGGLGGLGGLVNSIGGLFGDDGNEFDYNVGEDLRKWALSDWKFQTDYLREMQQKDFWRNRELGIDDVKKQGIRLKRAAKAAGFNPLTMLAAQGGMPGGVGGGGVASGPGGGGLPVVTSPGSNSGMAFKAVGHALEAFEEYKDKETELEKEALEDELEKERSGFGANHPGTKPRPAVTNPENKAVPESDGLTGSTPDMDSNPFMKNEITLGEDGTITSDHALVKDEDGMPRELETDLYSAAIGGSAIYQMEHTVRKNIMEAFEFEEWDKKRRAQMQSDFEYSQWKREMKAAGENWKDWEVGWRSHVPGSGGPTDRELKKIAKEKEYDKRLEEIRKKSLRNQ